MTATAARTAIGLSALFAPPGWPRWSMVDAAAGMPDELAGRALLDGRRGGPVLDRAELGTITARLGDLLAADPGLEEIEINPLRLTAGGLVALDAVVLTSSAREAGDAHPDQ